MTTASASTVGRRSPARSWTPRSQMTHGGAGGWREEGCPLISHLNPGMSQKAAGSKWHTGLRRTLGVAAPQGFSSLSLGASGCRRAVPRALTPERGRTAGPSASLCSWRWQGTVVVTFLSPSRLNSAAASLRHGFATRDAVLTLPASQDASRERDFCMKKKKFSLNPLCCQGLLSYLYRNCPSCTPFCPLFPSLLGMYFTRNSDWPPWAYRKHPAKKRKQIMWTQLNFPQGVIFLRLLLLNANASWQKDREEV